MDRPRLDRLRHAALPTVAVVLFAVAVPAVIATAGQTWGYDYEAYAGAARRLLDGAPLYDASVDLAGGFAIYLYPPPFALAFVPFAVLGTAGLVAWTAVLVAATVAGIALMPVPPRVRWWILLLAALSWPVMYSIKLGQVGPILLFLFALGWRWLDRGWPLGATTGAGALIKVQPALLLGWAALTGRWRALAVGVGIIAGVSLATLPLVGLESWREYATLLGRVNQPVTTPHNFTPGAILFQAGVPADLAAAVQVVVSVGALGLVATAALRLPAEASYLVAVVASQLVSPLLWDHYAIVLLLPVAWLLARGAWWAAAIPVATSLPLVGITPAAAYPLVFLLALLAPFVIPRTSRRVEAAAVAT